MAVFRRGERNSDFGVRLTLALWKLHFYTEAKMTKEHHLFGAALMVM